MKTIDPAIQRGLSVDIPSRIVITSSQKEADLDTHKWLIVYILSWPNIKNIKRYKPWNSSSREGEEGGEGGEEEEEEEEDVRYLFKVG